MHKCTGIAMWYICEIHSFHVFKYTGIALSGYMWNPVFSHV